MVVSDTSNQKKVLESYLWVTVFFAGLATMAVEFAASRLLGNVFGTSNLVWAVVIGLILVYLTLGNWLGGRWADQKPETGRFFTIVASAGVATALIPLLSRWLLQQAANAFDALNLPILISTFLTVLVLLSVPVTLLGTVTPFTLKLLLHDSATSGRTAGRLSALATLGSFIGTFLTVLVLIPAIGTYRTFLAVALLLLLMALPGLWMARKRLLSIIFSICAIIVVLLLATGVKGSIKTTQNQVYEGESAYNYIQVIEEDGYRFLRLNEGQGMQSIWHPTELFYGGPWSQFLLTPLFSSSSDAVSKVSDIAILGLAGGTTARQASVVYPQAQLDGWEIDPKIIRVGVQWFGMDLPNLEAHAEDARWGIAHSPKEYDIVAIDAYRPPYIPPHMVTVEFFREVYDHLKPNGGIAINVGRSPSDRSLVTSLSRTVAEVFPNVFVTDLPDSYNSIIFASKNPDTGWAYFEQNIEYLEEDSQSILLQAGRKAIEGKAVTQLSGEVFTDDRAPLEAITNRMVLNFLISGGINEK